MPKPLLLISSGLLALNLAVRATTVEVGAGPAAVTVVDAGLTPLSTTSLVLVGAFANPVSLTFNPTLSIAANVADMESAGGWNQFGLNPSTGVSEGTGSLDVTTVLGNSTVGGSVTDNVTGSPTASADFFNGDQIYLWIFNGPTIATSTQMGVFEGANATTPWLFPTNTGGVGDTVTLSMASPTVMTAVGGIGSVSNSQMVLFSSDYRYINASGPNTIADGTATDVVINAAGTSGAVAIAAATTNINTLTQGFTTASTIDTSPGTLRLGVSGGIFITAGSASLTIGTTPNSGILTAGGNAANVAGALLLENNSTNVLTINSIVTDNGTGVVSVTADGAGTTILAGTNTYSGATTVSNGILQIGTAGAAGSIGAGNAINVANGGTLSLVSIGGNTLANNVTNGVGGTGTLNINSANTNTLSGALTDGAAGNLALIQSGSGTTILTNGANTLSGMKTVSNGILQIGTAGIAGSIGGGVVGVGVGATLTLVNVNGNVLANTVTNGVGGVGTLNINSANTNTISGLLADGSGGQLALTQSGSGNTILTNANGYTGETNVNAGTLTVNGSLAAGSTVNVNSTGTLSGTGTVAGTVNVLSGGNLNPGGASTPGTLTIGSLVLNTGATATFRLAQSGVVGGGVNDLVSVTNNLTIAGNLNVTPLTGFGIGSYTLFTYGGALTNNGFSAINGLTGLTTSIVTGLAHEVNLVVSSAGAGTVQFWDGAGVANNGLISGGTGNWTTSTSNWTNSSGTTNSTWQNGTAVFAAPAGTVTLTSAINAQGLIFGGTGYVLGGADALTLTGSAPTISVTNAGTSATISAKIAGTAGLTASGAGTLILTNTANSVTGGMTVTNGIVQIGTTSTAGSIGGGVVGVGNGGSLALVDVSGSALANSVTNGLGGTGTLNINSATTNTLSGALSDGAAGQLALTQSGAGTTILTNAANTFSGATTISKGTLQIGTATAAGSLSAGGDVSLGGGSTLSVVNVAGNVLASNISNGLGGTALVNINSATNLTLSGTLSNGAGVLALTQSRTGATTLTGSNTYTGATTISAGTLQVGDGVTAGTSLGTGSVTVSGTGTLAINLSDASTFASNVNLSAIGATLKAVESNTNVLSGVISGTGVFDQSGPGTTVLSAAETYSGATNVSAGILEVDDSLAAGSTVNVTGGTLRGMGTIQGSATLNGGGNIDFNTNGNVVGTLAVTGGNWSGVGTVGGLVTSSSGTFAISHSGTLTASSGLAVTGGMLAGTGTLSGNLNYTSSASSIFGGVIAGAASTVTMNKTGGTLTLTGTNTYGGATTISAGTLQLGDGATTGTSLGAGPVTVVGAGVLAIDLADTSTFSKNVSLTVAGATVQTIQAGTNTLSGVISGTGGLKQNGAGTTIVTGVETYTGTTSVTTGTLQVDGSLAAGSTVNVAAAGTLDGAGTVAGTVNVLAGGNLSAGDSTGPGTLTVGKLVLNAGANANFRLAAPGTTGGGVNDWIDVTGNLTIAGNLNVTQLTGFGIGSYTLFTYGGTLTNTGFSSINGTGGFVGSVATGVAHQVDLVISGTAVTQYWDGTGAVNNGVISGGSGIWNSTTNNWTNSTGSTNSVWQGGTAVFDTPGGTVTVSAPISVQGLIFGSTGYTLSGSSALNLVGTAGTPPAISVTNAGTTATIGAPITGKSGLTASGAGTLILTSMTNSYTGGTNITNGLVQIGTTAAAGSIGGGTISIASSGMLTVINLHGNILSNSVTNGVAGIGTLNISSTTTNTLSGALTDGSAGQLALTQSGTGTAILTSAANAFSGATTISKGTLQIGTATAAGSLEASSAVSVGSGATLSLVNLAGNALANNISNGMSGTGLVSINATTNVTLSGALTNGSGTLALTKAGTGTTTLSGSDTYTGATTVSAGTLQIGNGTAGNLTGTSGVTVSGTGTLAMDLATGATFSQNVNLSAAGASLQGIEASGTTNTVSEVIGGTGIVNQNGAGKTILTGIETYTGATNVTTGTLEVDGILAAGSAVNVATSGTLTGLGTIKGKATLTGNGVIDLGGLGIIDGTLTVNGGNWTGVGAVLGLVTSSSATFNLADNLTAPAGLAVTGGTIAGTGTLTGSLNDTSSTSILFGGVIAGGASTVTMNKVSSTLTLTGTNTYGGATTITAGTLQVGNGTTTGATLSTSTVIIGASGTLTTDLATGETFGNNVTDSGHVVATGTTNNYTVSSLISGTGNLTKTGANIVTVTNANTYKGGTVIGGGTLLVNNSTGSGTGTGAVTVNSSGTLGGGGTISGATTLNSGGTLFPGAGTPGTAGTTLHESSMVWNGGGTLTLQLADGGVDDALALTGALTKGTVGTYTLDLINAGLVSTNTYNLTLVTFASTTFTAANFNVELPVNFTGMLVKTSTSLEIENLTDPSPSSGELPERVDSLASGDSAAPPLPGVGFDSDSSSSLSVTPTPEPGSAALFFLGGGALLGWRRRRSA